MNLADYQIDTSALLHDQNNLYTGLFQLNRWINEARDQVAQDTGCLRTLIAGQAPFGVGAQAGSAVPGGAIPGQAPVTEFQTIGRQEVYQYAYANAILKAQNRGMRAVCDVFGCAVSWGGAIRPVQNWMPWDELQAFGRSYNIGVFSYPFAWSNTGSGEGGRVWLWPAASVQTEMEWDAFCLPSKLNTNDDYEALPGMYQKAVKYWTASLAYDASNRNSQADVMRQRYMQQIGSAAGASERARVRDYYADFVSW